MPVCYLRLAVESNPYAIDFKGGQSFGEAQELRRWVAKDATDHGQVIADLDFTSDTIFERLETDVQFRSVATALVYRYGYLVPKLNPDLELANEHELLVHERAKWLAQSQEVESSQAPQRTKMNLQNIASCDRQTDAM